jgi:hypothetical protein
MVDILCSRKYTGCTLHHKIALARGADSENDSYVPGTGTVKERPYIWSKTTIAEKDMGDNTLEELFNDLVRDVDIPPSLTAPARAQRSTRKLMDGSYLLNNSDDEDDVAMDDNVFFDWDI